MTVTRYVCVDVTCDMGEKCLAYNLDEREASGGAVSRGDGRTFGQAKRAAYTGGFVRHKGKDFCPACYAALVGSATPTKGE